MTILIAYLASTLVAYPIARLLMRKLRDHYYPTLADRPFPGDCVEQAILIFMAAIWPIGLLLSPLAYSLTASALGNPR